MDRREFLWIVGGGLLTCAAGAATAGCAPGGPLPGALLSCRSWLSFAPPRPYNPEQARYPSQAQLRRSLRALKKEGWRGLVTYTLDGTLQHVPRLAKEVGFKKVIAGLFWFDAAQLGRERSAALRHRRWIDGYVLGNEGLQFGRYTRAALESEIARLKRETGRPTATSEPHNQYLADPTLLSVGDWAFPNVHPWFAQIRSPAEGARFTREQYEALQQSAPDRTIVIKEAWWPSAGGAGASAANQTAFFRNLAATNVPFIWGEAYDQFWKDEEGAQGPHWGLHTDRRKAKPVVGALKRVYTGPYPR